MINSLDHLGSYVDLLLGQVDLGNPNVLETLAFSELFLPAPQDSVQLSGDRVTNHPGILPVPETDLFNTLFPLSDTDSPPVLDQMGAEDHVNILLPTLEAAVEQPQSVDMTVLPLASEISSLVGDQGSLTTKVTDISRKRKWANPETIIERKKQKRGLVSEHLIASQWHPTLNTKGPDQYTTGSSANIWWRCEKNPDHVWEATIGHRCRENNPKGCPKCRHHVPKGSKPFVSQHKVASQWHPTLNTERPDQVTTGSARKAWWICKKNPDHVWETRISDRCKEKNPVGCPLCAGFVPIYTKPLVSQHKIASQWHPTLNTKGHDQFTTGSSQKAWWICEKNPDHVWEAKIGSRCREKNPSGCPERRRGK